MTSISGCHTTMCRGPSPRTLRRTGTGTSTPRRIERCPSVEAARIQTFPDRFRFAGHPSNRFHQIGNAVPPMLAAAMAASMRRALDGESEAVLPGGIGEPSAGTHGFRDDLVRWFRQNGRRFPWRGRELTAWQMLLVEMCLHRTRADQVALVAEDILSHARTPEQFIENADRLAPSLAHAGAPVAIGEPRLSGEVREGRSGRMRSGQLAASREDPRRGGLHRVRRPVLRVRSIHRAHGHQHPENSPQGCWGTLPNQASWRLRLGLRELAAAEGANAEWNMGLLDLGALVCTARAPRCMECPVAQPLCNRTGVPRTALPSPECGKCASRLLAPSQRWCTAPETRWLGFDMNWRNNGRPGYHWPGIGVPKSHLRVFVTIEGDIGSPSPT